MLPYPPFLRQPAKPGVCMCICVCVCTEVTPLPHLTGCPSRSQIWRIRGCTHNARHRAALINPTLSFPNSSAGHHRNDQPWWGTGLVGCRYFLGPTVTGGPGMILLEAWAQLWALRIGWSLRVCWASQTTASLSWKRGRKWRWCGLIFGLYIPLPRCHPVLSRPQSLMNPPLSLEGFRGKWVHSLPPLSVPIADPFWLFPLSPISLPSLLCMRLQDGGWWVGARGPPEGGQGQAVRAARRKEPGALEEGDQGEGRRWGQGEWAHGPVDAHVWQPRGRAWGRVTVCIWMSWFLSGLLREPGSHPWLSLPSSAGWNCPSPSSCPPLLWLQRVGVGKVLSPVCSPLSRRPIHTATLRRLRSPWKGQPGCRSPARGGVLSRSCGG